MGGGGGEAFFGDGEARGEATLGGEGEAALGDAIGDTNGDATGEATSLRGEREAGALGDATGDATGEAATGEAIGEGTPVTPFPILPMRVMRSVTSPSFAAYAAAGSVGVSRDRISAARTYWAWFGKRVGSVSGSARASAANAIASEEVVRSPATMFFRHRATTSVKRPGQ